MSKDTIYREDAIKVLYQCTPFDPNGIALLEKCEKKIDALPSADKQGNWVVITLYVQGKAPKPAVRCSECKRIPMWLGSPLLPTKSGNLLEFCPHCGAKMEEADDES